MTGAELHTVQSAVDHADERDPSKGVLFVIGVRLVMLGLLLAVGVVGDVGWGGLYYYAVLAIAFAVTIPYGLRLRDPVGYDDWLPLPFVVDGCVVTALMALTGGVHSELIILYPMVVLSSGFIGRPPHVVRVALFCITIFLLMCVAAQKGWLPPSSLSSLQTTYSVGGIALIQFSAVAVFAGLTYLIALKRMKMAHKEKQMLESERQFLREWPSGFVLLDHESKILLANRQATELLVEESRVLAGRSFQAMLDPRGTRSIPESGSVAPRTLLRKDGQKVECNMQVRSIRSPAGVASGHDGQQDVRLVWLNDPSGTYTGDRKPASSADVAAEIAHEIRNPLAAISGCVQVLLDLERKAMLGDERSVELLRSERSTLFESIVTETSRLDRILEKFIDFSEFSSDRLAMVLNWDDHGRQPDTPLRSAQPVDLHAAHPR